LQGARKTGTGKVARMDLRLGSQQEQGGRFQQAMWRTSDAPLRYGNEIGLLKNGPATYEDWLAAIGGARRWVHLENYIFAENVGRQFADALCEKAREGVPVRVIYDWYGCTDVWVSNSFWRKLRSAGVEVRVANPPSLSRGVRRFVARDHRKVVGVDGSYASVGGICIADGWLERSSETGLIYRDTAANLRGPAVADVERAFAGTWDLFGEKPLPDEERPDANSIEAAGEKATRVVIQEPGRARVLRTLEVLLATASERMWIADAYFLSAPTLTQALMSAARDGVDVRILLPATNDVRWVGALSRAGYRPLLEAGVRIFEYGGPMMHAKTHVVDGRFSRVGSTNLNFSGLLANWEADLMVEDPSFGAQMDEMFEEDLENSREVRLYGSPGARRPRPTPERPISAAQRRDGRRTRRGNLPSSLRGSSGATPATLSRVGGQAIRGTNDGGSLDAQERKIHAAVSGGVLGLSLLAARHPRLLAWPQAAVGILAGGFGLLHAARRGSSEGAARGAPDRRED
jgi:cardiolipin synthase A/B